MTGNVPSIDKPIPKNLNKGASLAPLQLPKIPVYKNVAQYLLSKTETKRVKKTPEWDIPRGGPAMELARAQREFHDSDNRLQNTRDEYVKRRVELDALWEELRVKEDQLRENFIKFSPFTRENIDKRERAERKIKDELRVQEQKEESIKDMKEQVDHMTNIKNKMEEYVEKYKFYEDFLLNVLDISTEFKDITGMLNRYETLAEARVKLGENQAKDLEILEQTRADMIQTTEKKAYMIIGFNTKIAELQNRFERVKAHSIECETQMALAKNVCHMKKVNLKLVQDSVRNLYGAICARKGIEPTVPPNDIENQLMYIKQTLVDLKRIIRIAKKRAARELQTTIPVTALPKVSIVQTDNK